MPSKKKKYNARFPAGRIKKIMQTDEEVGKVAQAVPVIISRTLELFVGSLLTKSMQITHYRNAKTLTPSHMKQCILSESRFDFLKDLVKNIPDASAQEDNENNAIFEAHLHEEERPPSPQPAAIDLSAGQQGTSRTPVIQYGPKVALLDKQHSFSVNKLVDDRELSPAGGDAVAGGSQADRMPPLVPISQNFYMPAEDNLCIDEDYDN